MGSRRENTLFPYYLNNASIPELETELAWWSDKAIREELSCSREYADKELALISRALKARLEDAYLVH